MPILVNFTILNRLSVLPHKTHRRMDFLAAQESIG
jgi:hypothetical protein